MLVPGVHYLLNETINAGIVSMEAQVSGILDADSKWWDLNRVRAQFNPKAIAKIIKIVPSPSGEVDKWI